MADINKEWVVDFENKSNGKTVVVGKIYAKDGRQAIEFSLTIFEKPDEWECVGLDRVAN